MLSRGMSRRGRWGLAVWLVFVLFAVQGAQAQPGATWTPTGSMATARYGHTATVLPSGQVLVVGGQDSSGLLDSAELYDPAMGTWSSTASLGTGRFIHTATLLGSGQVLVAGGAYSSNMNDTLATVELYDPATGTWSPASHMLNHRGSHSATLLPSGQVLVAGGDNGSWPPLNVAELYTPPQSSSPVNQRLVVPSGSGRISR